MWSPRSARRFAATVDQLQTEALKALDARMEGMPPGQGVRIGCSRLVRVDFGAAGSLLNWVLAREAEGRSVQFTDLHRMITGFFRVIGIHEHARLISRSN